MAKTGFAENPDKEVVFKPADAQSASQPGWSFPRGDANASGTSSSQLPDQLAVVWEFKAGEAIETTPVIDATMVFTADVMGTLYAIDRKNGTEVWRKEYDTGFLASPIVAGDQIVIGDVDGNVYALAKSDGSERWKQVTDGEISGSAAIYEDKVLVASQDGKLYCYTAKDGKLVWTYQADDQIRCSPTVAGDRTFLGGCDAKLHVIDLKTGKAASETMPLGGPTGSTPAVSGNIAVVPVMEGAVLAFDWKSPKQLWSYEDFEQSQEYRSSAAVSDKVAIVSSQRKVVDAIDLKTGKRLWRHTLRRRADASPVIAGNDVWVPATDGRLLRLSLADGKEKWSYEIRGAFISGVAVTDKELFVADDKGVVRCFR